MISHRLVRGGAIRRPCLDHSGPLDQITDDPLLRGADDLDRADLGFDLDRLVRAGRDADAPHGGDRDRDQPERSRDREGRRRRKEVGLLGHAFHGRETDDL